MSSAGVMLLSTALGEVSSQAQAQAQQKTYAAQQKQALMHAKYAEEKAEAEANAIERQTDSEVARQRSMLAKSGVEVSSGSALRAQEATAAEGALAAAKTRAEGAMESATSKNSAAMSAYNAEASKVASATGLGQSLLAMGQHAGTLYKQLKD